MPRCNVGDLAGDSFCCVLAFLVRDVDTENFLEHASRPQICFDTHDAADFSAIFPCVRSLLIGIFCSELILLALLQPYNPY